MLCEPVGRIAAMFSQVYNECVMAQNGVKTIFRQIDKVDNERKLLLFAGLFIITAIVAYVELSKLDSESKCYKKLKTIIDIFYILYTTSIGIILSDYISCTVSGDLSSLCGNVYYLLVCFAGWLFFSFWLIKEHSGKSDLSLFSCFIIFIPFVFTIYTLFFEYLCIIANSATGVS